MLSWASRLEPHTRCSLFRVMDSPSRVGRCTPKHAAGLLVWPKPHRTTHGTRGRNLAAAVTAAPECLGSCCSHLQRRSSLPTPAAPATLSRARRGRHLAGASSPIPEDEVRALRLDLVRCVFATRPTAPQATRESGEERSPAEADVRSTVRPPAGCSTSPSPVGACDPRSQEVVARRVTAGSPPRPTTCRRICWRASRVTARLAVSTPAVCAPPRWLLTSVILPGTSRGCVSRGAPRDPFNPDRPAGHVRVVGVELQAPLGPRAEPAGFRGQLAPCACSRCAPLGRGRSRLQDVALTLAPRGSRLYRRPDGPCRASGRGLPRKPTATAAGRDLTTPARGPVDAAVPGVDRAWHVAFPEGSAPCVGTPRVAGRTSTALCCPGKAAWRR